MLYYIVGLLTISLLPNATMVTQNLFAVGALTWLTLVNRIQLKTEKKQ